MALVDAYAYGLEAKRVRELLKIREVYTTIVNNIVANLGGDVLSIRQVLEMAAEHLIEARRPVPAGGATSDNDSWKFYKRVAFFLVDPSGARIEAVVERPVDERHAAFQPTSYTIDEHTVSGQTWVVSRRSAWSRMPGKTRECAKKSSTGSMWLRDRDHSHDDSRE